MLVAKQFLVAIELHYIEKDYSKVYGSQSETEKEMKTSSEKHDEE